MVWGYFFVVVLLVSSGALAGNPVTWTTAAGLSTAKFSRSSHTVWEFLPTDQRIVAIGDAWVHADDPEWRLDGDVWLSMFRDVGYHDEDQPAQPPETIRLWRGGTLAGMSWTGKREKAEWFRDRRSDSQTCVDVGLALGPHRDQFGPVPHQLAQFPGVRRRDPRVRQTPHPQQVRQICGVALIVFDPPVRKRLHPQRMHQMHRRTQLGERISGPIVG